MHHYAAYNGTAPTQASSGTKKRRRLNPRGNRNLNHAIHTIAICQLRYPHTQGIFGPIAENPQRLGEPLVGELEGLRSARRGDYRVIYETLEEDETVLVHCIQHRRDAYRPR